MGARSLVPPIARPRRTGRAARVVDFVCRAGRSARPYPERHGAWSIAIVRRGAFSYRTAATGHTHALYEGWLLLGRAGDEFECSHEHDGGDDCTAVELSPDLVEEIARAVPGCGGTIFDVPVLPPNPRAAALFERLDDPAAPDGDPDELALRVAHAVVSQVCHAAPRAVHVTPADRARVEAAIRHIETSFATPLSLADLAAGVELSPFHFLRVFRRVAGLTPYQYLIGTRLRRAARMLATTARPVTEIAYDAGFEDLSNFVRTFHRVVGRSPRAYRRSDRA